MFEIGYLHTREGVMDIAAVIFSVVAYGIIFGVMTDLMKHAKETRTIREAGNNIYIAANMQKIKQRRI